MKTLKNKKLFTALMLLCLSLISSCVMALPSSSTSFYLSSPTFSNGSDYGDLLYNGDFYCRIYFVGNYLCDHNYNIQIYERAVVETMYKDGTKNLGTTSTLYNFDRLDTNNNRVYTRICKDGSKETFTVKSDYSCTLIGFASTCYYTVGYKQQQTYSNTPVPNNGSYNNSYNNINTGGSTSRTCSLCNGSGRCCGAGNVAFYNQYCGGTGRCHPCNGTGWMTNTVTGNKTKCTYCGGSGVCSHCRGTGSCERCGGSGKH